MKVLAVWQLTAVEMETQGLSEVFLNGLAASPELL
jgi:hypothetical protein